MRGYTIQNSINLLEKGGGGGGASSASNVSFDNTGTGLAATNVQTALSEVAGRSDISSTEKQIGTLNGDPLYAKSFEAIVTTDNIVVANQIYTGDVSNIIPADAKAPVWVTVSSGVYYLGGASVHSTDHWVTTIATLYQQTSTPITGIAFYTKAAPVTTKTRKKK